MWYPPSTVSPNRNRSGAVGQRCPERHNTDHLTFVVIFWRVVDIHFVEYDLGLQCLSAHKMAWHDTDVVTDLVSKAQTPLTLSLS